MKKSPKQNEYGAESIKSLSFVDHVRRRPAMYVTDTGSAGLHQLVWEVVDNGVDEYLAGHNVYIEVRLEKDGSCTVIDHGRGIPVGRDSEGVSALTRAVGILMSGGKFDDDTGRISAGLHGVGVKATNYLSSVFEVEVLRNSSKEKGCFSARFEKGLLTQDVQKIKQQAKKWPDSALRQSSSGTVVRFRPDEEIFGKFSWSPDWIKKTLRETSFTCPGLTLVFRQFDEKGQCDHEEYRSDEGLTGRLKELISEYETEFRHDPIVVKTDNVEVSLAWTFSSRDERVVSYVNTKFMEDGGTHETGLRRAVTTVINRHKEAAGLDPKDFRAGLFAVVHYKTPKPQFKGQSKSRLNNKEADGHVSRACTDQLQAFFDANPDLAEFLIERAKELSKIRSRMKSLDKVLSKIESKSSGSSVLPGKLASAPNCQPKDRELYLVEGNSAGGSAKKARDPHYQEVLPLRGKLLNAVRASPESVLRNAEIQDIIAAIGVRPDAIIEGDSCDPAKARVGRVLLLMDADPDGQHIVTLVVGFFMKFLRPLVREGRLYVVQSPLFVGKKGTQRVFGDTLAEVQQKLPGAKVTRLKGHGEAEPDEVQAYAMNPISRRLIQVQDKQGDVVFELLGKDVDPRRDLLGLQVDRQQSQEVFLFGRTFDRTELPPKFKRIMKRWRAARKSKAEKRSKNVDQT